MDRAWETGVGKTNVGEWTQPAEAWGFCHDSPHAWSLDSSISAKWFKKTTATFFRDVLVLPSFETNISIGYLSSQPIPADRYPIWSHPGLPTLLDPRHYHPGCSSPRKHRSPNPARIPGVFPELNIWKKMKMNSAARLDKNHDMSWYATSIVKDATCNLILKIS